MKGPTTKPRGACGTALLMLCLDSDSKEGNQGCIPSCPSGQPSSHSLSKRKAQVRQNLSSWVSSVPWYHQPQHVLGIGVNLWSSESQPLCCKILLHFQWEEWKWVWLPGVPPVFQLQHAIRIYSGLPPTSIMAISNSAETVFLWWITPQDSIQATVWEHPTHDIMLPVISHQRISLVHYHLPLQIKPNASVRNLAQFRLSDCTIWQSSPVQIKMESGTEITKKLF